MIFQGKQKVLTTPISACDYEFMLSEITSAFKKNNSLLISPLASQTLVKAYFNKDLQRLLGKFDYLVPDSQWVRHSLYFLYGKKLKDRVYGPKLMQKICQLSSEKKYKIFLFGPSKKTMDMLSKRLKILYPKIIIVDVQVAKFPPFAKEYKEELVRKITAKKTDIFLMALSSPMEQIFSQEIYSKITKMNKKFFVAMPVGAAFDFISRNKKQAPPWMQQNGLEWFFRFLNEPRRLWFRYFVLGPLFVVLIIIQKAQILFDTAHNIVIKNKTGR